MRLSSILGNLRPVYWLDKRPWKRIGGFKNWLWQGVWGFAWREFGVSLDRPEWLGQDVVFGGRDSLEDAVDGFVSRWGDSLRDLSDEQLQRVSDDLVTAAFRTGKTAVAFREMTGIDLDEEFDAETRKRTPAGEIPDG